LRRISGQLSPKRLSTRAVLASEHFLIEG
jgi:hypothetical protein